VPWGAMSESPHDFIDAKYLCEEAKLRDPSKMSKLEAHCHLKFWYNRQEDPKCKIAFEFHAVKCTRGGKIVPVASLATRDKGRPVQVGSEEDTDGASISDSAEEDRDQPLTRPSQNRPLVGHSGPKRVKDLPFSAIRREGMSNRHPQPRTARYLRAKGTKSTADFPAEDKVEQSSQSNGTSGTVQAATRRQPTHGPTRVSRRLRAKSPEDGGADRAESDGEEGSRDSHPTSARSGRRLTRSLKRLQRDSDDAMENEVTPPRTVARDKRKK
jgi:hypothetical protein